MPDADHAAMIPLGDALARLPLETPERSAWPALAARLQARRRRPRWPFAAAAAAALLALALAPRLSIVEPARVATTSTTVAADAKLAALMDESARLERLLGAARDDSASSASAAAMSLDLEDRVSALDMRLQARGITPDQQLVLWQQRIVLLREAASLETSRHYLAASGQSLDVALVAAY